MVMVEQGERYLVLFTGVMVVLWVLEGRCGLWVEVGVGVTV